LHFANNYGVDQTSEHGQNQSEHHYIKLSPSDQ